MGTRFCGARVRTIGRKVVEKFKRNHAGARASLDNWYRVVSSRDWNNFAEFRQVVRSAGPVDSHVVFNVGGNKYRLIADVNFRAKTLLIRDVLTYRECDRGGWKKA